jgi:hypothetical protein
MTASLVNKEVVSERYDLPALMNLRDYQDQSPEVRVYKGVLYKRPLDIKNYLEHISHRSDIISNTVSLFSGRWDRFSDGTSSLRASVDGENPVLHDNLFGTCSDSGRYGLIRSYEDDPPAYQSLLVESLDPPYFMLSGGVSPPSGMFFDLFTELDGTEYSGRTGSITRAYRQLSYTGGEFGDFVASWYYGVQYDNAVANRRDVNWFAVRLTFNFTSSPLAVQLGETVDADDIIMSVVRVEWAPCVFAWCSPINSPQYPDIFECWEDYPDSFPALDSDWSGMTGYYSGSASRRVVLATEPAANLDDLLGYDRFAGRYVYGGDDSFLRFRSWADRAVTEAIPALALSYASAMDSHFTAFESNHIEALMELSEILAPIELGAMAAVLPRYVSRKGVLLVGILDLLCNAYLVWKFGLAPTIDDADDVARNAGSFRTRVLSGEVFKANTISGKEIVVVEEDNSMGIPPCVVTLRSKVRTKYHPDSLMTAAFTADSVGLLPRLSTLWDLVPWSFLVDWFTPVGEYLQIVDSQAKILALDMTYCVHSISVKRYFTDGELTSYGVSSVPVNGHSGCGYHKYLRIVSTTPPVFGPTRLPVTNQPGVPDWGIAGSLAWLKLK